MKGLPAEGIASTTAMAVTESTAPARSPSSIDSGGTKRRLEKLVPRAEVVYLREAGHFIPGQTAKILEFLTQGVC